MRVLLAMLSSVWLLATGCSAGSVGAESPPTPPEDESSVVESLWGEVRALYDRARETGEEVPADIYEWVRRDIENIGDWEYRVELLAVDVSPGTLQATLNELGDDRWEAVWLSESTAGVRVILKRPTRSYLTRMPLAQLLKLLSGGASAGDAGA